MKYQSKKRIFLLVFEIGKLAAIISFIFKLFSGLILPFTAYAFQNLIDDIITSFYRGEKNITFTKPLLMVAGIYIFQAIEEPIVNYCDFFLRQRLNHFFGKMNLEKIAKINYCHFENSDDLDLIKRIEDSTGDAAVDFFNNILNLFSGVIKIIGTFLLLMNYNFYISLAVLLVSIPIIIMASKYGKYIHNWYEKNSKKRRRLEYLSSIFVDRTTALEIKQYNHYSYLNETWKNQFKELRLQDFKLQIKAWKNVILSGLLLNLFEYTTYFLMLLPTAAGSITIGAFIGLSKAISNIEGIILWDFSYLFTFFSRNTEYWKDYNTFLDLDEIQSAALPVRSDTNDFSIEFRHVFFRYENMETDVLSDINFTIQANQLCGLVGINGAGKSTLSKLMLGLYKPTSGDILINGQSTKEMSFDEQVSFFGVTYQDFNKYNISVLENIALSSSGIDSMRVKKILDVLDFDYNKLPLGIDTIIGRSFGNGTDLSGGEWQKIAIARMLFTDASFYIMDEPTASLDPMSEVALYKQIKTALLGKTSLLITHRLGAAVLCDKILVLDNGKIVESGSHSDLLQRSGLYAKMYNEQKKWYKK